MKKTRKIVALLLAALFLTVLLAGCSSKQCVWCGKSFRGAGHNTGAGYVCDDCYNSLSGVSSSALRGGSNTGVWIAVVVMVFIAVFSATSGVVYLVLQKKLPPKRPASRSRRVPEETMDMDDFEPTWSSPARPVNNTPPRPYGGVWICPRDKTRNSGPYCSVCGSNRPSAPRPAGNNSAPGQARPQTPVSRPQSPADVRRSERVAAPQNDSGVNRQPIPAQRRPASPAPRSSEPDQWPTATRPSTPPAPAKEPYRPRFARPEPEETEPEVDSELLAAIFREAAKDPEE